MYCYFFLLFSFSFGGRIPHPPFVLLLLSIYSCMVSYQKKKMKLYCDNKATINIAHNPMQYDRTKHIEVN